MTASELIEKLKEYPPETVVAVCEYESGDYEEVTGMDFRDATNPYWLGGCPAEQFIELTRG